MATANTISGILNGARQAEVTINGIGERAGNTSLEEVAMIFKSHKDLNIDTNINNAKNIQYQPFGFEALCSMPVTNPIKPLWDVTLSPTRRVYIKTAYWKNRENYEIIDPRDVGIDENSSSYRRSGRAALKHRRISWAWNSTKRLSIKHTKIS